MWEWWQNALHRSARCALITKHRNGLFPNRLARGLDVSQRTWDSVGTLAHCSSLEQQMTGLETLVLIQRSLCPTVVFFLLFFSSVHSSRSPLCPSFSFFCSSSPLLSSPLFSFLLSLTRTHPAVLPPSLSQSSSSPSPINRNRLPCLPLSHLRPTLSGTHLFLLPFSDRKPCSCPRLSLSQQTSFRRKQERKTKQRCPMCHLIRHPSHPAQPQLRVSPQ